MTNMENKFALELAMSLEAVHKYHLKDGLVINSLANLIHQYDIKDLPLLNELAESLLSINNSKPEEKTILFTPESLLQADIIEKGIAYEVGEIRKDVFGSESVPFGDRDSVMGWLKLYAKTQEQIWQALNTEHKKLDKLVEGQKGYVGLGWEEIEGMFFTDDTAPVKLTFRVRELANEIGADEKSLLMHVLVNTKLIVRRWKMGYKITRGRLPVTGLEYGVAEMRLSFNRKLNSEDIRQIFKRLAEDLHYRKSKQITAKHLELYRLVNEKQIPKGRGKVTFWKGIAEEWNNRYPEATYTSWKGPNLAYNRLMKNLSQKNLVHDEKITNQVLENDSPTKETDNARTHRKEG